MKKLLFTLAISSQLFGAIPLIEKVTIKKNRVDIKINKQFKLKYLKEDFFVE